MGPACSAAGVKGSCTHLARSSCVPFFSCQQDVLFRFTKRSFAVYLTRFYYLINGILQWRNDIEAPWLGCMNSFYKLPCTIEAQLRNQAQHSSAALSSRQPGWCWWMGCDNSSINLDKHTLIINVHEGLCKSESPIFVGIDSTGFRGFHVLVDIGLI